MTAPESPRIRIAWANGMLRIDDPRLPGRPITIHYLEAYCRAGSTDRMWEETVVRHRSDLLWAADDGTALRLRDTVDDGLVVEHAITAGTDEVRFEIVAKNPTRERSVVHWAQPCVRLAESLQIPASAVSTGKCETYLPSSFLMIDGQFLTLPTQPWATKARYTPGQVYPMPGVAAEDVNPRPLSTLTPSHPLIGCRTPDGYTIGIAWSPCQELFQGIFVCLHADFRLGGVQPGEELRIRGRLWILKDGPEALRARFAEAFPAA